MPRGGYLPRLKTATTPPASALDEPPTFAKSGNIAPLNYFGDGKFYAVNTMQPPYQPSGNKPARGDASFAYADPEQSDHAAAANAARPSAMRWMRSDIDWAWYAGAWNAAVKDGRRPPAKMREVIYAPETAGGNPDFQPHHQPFNYYAALRSRHPCGTARGASEGLRAICWRTSRPAACRR